MRPNSYPESQDMDSNLERNIKVFKKIPLMLLLVHIGLQAMINVRQQALQNIQKAQCRQKYTTMLHTTLIKANTKWELLCY